MAKWEYKTAEFTNQRDFEAQTPALGEEGWELVSEKQINGWIVASFKRSLASEDFSGLDTVSNLISLLADPKKTEKTISSLKEAYSKHVEAIKSVEASTKEHNALVESVQASLSALKTKNDELDARFAELETRKAAIEALEADHSIALAGFENLKADHNKKVEEAQDSINKQEAGLAGRSIQLQSDLKSREDAVLKREKNVSNKESSLAKKEEEHASIKEQAEQLAALVTGRRV